MPDFRQPDGTVNKRVATANNKAAYRVRIQLSDAGFRGDRLSSTLNPAGPARVTRIHSRKRSHQRRGNALRQERRYRGSSVDARPPPAGTGIDDRPACSAPEATLRPAPYDFTDTSFQQRHFGAVQLASVKISQP